MKYLFFIFLLSTPLFSNPQLPNQKLSKDSINYYQRELGKLWRDTYDSLKNSNRYKEIVQKLNDKKGGKVVTVELLANVGLYFTDFKNLNERLKSIGHEEIKTMVPSLGASLAVGKPIMTYGMELDSYVFENENASFKGIHGRIYIATNLFKKSPIVFHPQIGYAGSILNMSIHRSFSQVNFNDLFMTQANTIQLSHLQSYLDLALGLKLKSPKADNFYWQFLRVGYRYGLKATSWGMRDGAINKAPVDRNNQFYLQFCLGFDRD